MIQELEHITQEIFFGLSQKELMSNLTISAWPIEEHKPTPDIFLIRLNLLEEKAARHTLSKAPCSLTILIVSSTAESTFISILNRRLGKEIRSLQAKEFFLH